MAASVIPIPIPIEAPVERDDECVLGVEGLWDEGVDEEVEEDVELGVELGLELDPIGEGVEEDVGLDVELGLELELEPEDPAGTTFPPWALPEEEEEEVPAAADM
jgi:hypothetical protein